MPIRLRLAILSAASAFVLCVIGGAMFVHVLAESLRSSADSSLRASADAIVQGVKSTRNPLDLHDPIVSGLASPRQTIAEIIAPNGELGDASDSAQSSILIDALTLRRARSATVFTNGAMPGRHDRLRIVATPVRRADGTWIVVAAQSTAADATALDRVTLGLVIAGVLLVLIAASGAWFLATLALRPVERMRIQAARAATHGGHATLDVPATRDEISRLAQTMNDLLARLSESLARQRAFVADAGHDLRTPITLLQSELALAAREGRTLDELRAAIDAARGDVARLARLADQLLFLARQDEAPGDAPRDIQPLHPILERCAGRARRHARLRDVTLVSDIPLDLAAPVVADDLERAVDNVLDNALRNAPPGSSIEITARRIHRLDGGFIEIEVSDGGPGFPGWFIPHAFERFHRLDTARATNDAGSGLGLAIVQAVAKRHGGGACVANASPRGARVTLWLACEPDPGSTTHRRR